MNTTSDHTGEAAALGRRSILKHGLAGVIALVAIALGLSRPGGASAATKKASSSSKKTVGKKKASSSAVHEADGEGEAGDNDSESGQPDTGSDGSGNSANGANGA